MKNFESERKKLFAKIGELEMEKQWLKKIEASRKLKHRKKSVFRDALKTFIMNFTIQLLVVLYILFIAIWMILSLIFNWDYDQFIPVLVA